MRISGINPSFSSDLFVKDCQMIPKNTKTSWSQKRRLNKPIKLQFLSIVNTDDIDALETLGIKQSRP